MRRALLSTVFCLALTLLSCLPAQAQHAGKPDKKPLIIAQDGQTSAIIVVSPDAAAQSNLSPRSSAGWESRAAADLAHYIQLMTGATPAIANTPDAIAQALKSKAPLLIVGEEALKARSSLKKDLAKVAKKDPFTRADAIVVERDGNRIYLAGTNEESHYFAAAWLLQQWGCRWYLPTEFGESIPEHSQLTVGDLDFVYAPPFEIRNYWISWNGSYEGAAEFQRRNFMNSAGAPGGGHALAAYTKELIPPGKSSFNVPFAEPQTAEHIAAKLDEQVAKGVPGISIAIEDGAYSNDSPLDRELVANLYDKYFLNKSLTDPMMVLYSRVAGILHKKYPNSPTKIGGMAYVNVTIPPQREFKTWPNLVMWLAPIDIDPNHGMDDPRSPPRQEYREMVYRWSQVMEGRVVIYDYDQGALVWRDIPNPSIAAVRQDMKHYARAGILGISTESRNAIATTFLNLYVRGQLMWNPDADVNQMLAEFYPNFYGSAAEPMSRYWGKIFKVWDDTLVTEHEHMMIPALYTPALMAELAKDLAEAEKIVKPLAGKSQPTRNEQLLVERMKFTRLSFDVMNNYVAMVNAAASEVDYTKAVEAGKRGLAAVLGLAKMNPTFTTRVDARLDVIEPAGDAAWWPGEVKQYADLLAFTDGSRGKLIAKLPLEWAFHRDPNDTGLASGWAYKEADLSFWKGNHQNYTLESRKDYPTTQWEMIRTDLYAQAQGVRHPDEQSFTGYLWYKTDVDLSRGQAQGPINLYFPGLFNEGWLYVNGYLVAHRPQNAMWWYNSYKFEWDVDLTGKLKPGKNQITLRLHNPHHFGGIFRRPFLYQPSAAELEARGAAK